MKLAAFSKDQIPMPCAQLQHFYYIKQYISCRAHSPSPGHVHGAGEPPIPFHPTRPNTKAKLGSTSPVPD